MDALVSGVEGAGRAMVVQDRATGEFYIESAGSSIEGILGVDGVDKSRIYTNDMFEMNRVFGIEAARNTLAKELKDTIEGQGITISSRHLLLVADAMTSQGKIESIGRHGLANITRLTKDLKEKFHLENPQIELLKKKILWVMQV